MENSIAQERLSRWKCTTTCQRCIFVYAVCVIYNYSSIDWDRRKVSSYSSFIVSSKFHISSQILLGIPTATTAPHSLTIERSAYTRQCS